jgi:hypothetical protein
MHFRWQGLVMEAQRLHGNLVYNIFRAIVRQMIAVRISAHGPFCNG